MLTTQAHRRDGVPPTHSVRLLLLSDATDGDGSPRPALLVIDLRAGRAVLRAFATIAAALAAKHSMEAVQ